MDILIVVAEIFSEERQPAHMEGVFCHGKAEAHGTFVIQFQFADTDIGEFLAIQKGSFTVDNQRLQRPYWFQ